MSKVDEAAADFQSATKDHERAMQEYAAAQAAMRQRQDEMLTAALRVEATRIALLKIAAGEE